MMIKCEHCASRIKVADSAFEKGTPTVLCPICKKTFVPQDVKPLVEKQGIQGNAENRPTSENSNENNGIGWLVVHDENAPLQTYSLKIGRQIIGKKSTTRPCDIMVETDDDYMSRNHFIIAVEQNKRNVYEYYLSDCNSLNGTFINTVTLQALKKGDEYILQDSDIIQAGRTKIVFKSNKTAKNEKEATLLVSNQPKGKTVLV
ncbi:MAG: FHA domain-containing protein [Dysgonamonadaceae bacterium]|jgi:predicted Zn finger-like uncharacterized protein|nr:FHA domain-containing protein [Dysgonamonadaceae bacterium]